MIMTKGIANYSNEMTSEVSTITPDLTLPTETEKIISTESKFGFFDRQMAELEPKVCFKIMLIPKLLLNYLHLFIIGPR